MEKRTGIFRDDRTAQVRRPGRGGGNPIRRSDMHTYKTRWSLVLLLVGSISAPAAAGDKLVHFRLRGELPEAPPKMELNLFSLGAEQPISMYDLLKALNKARKDDTVRGVLFELDEAALGFAQIQELRAQFEKLKSADKDVWVYTEVMTPGQYLLASAASKVVMMPKGELVLMGLYGEASYFKRMLDKIGVQADIIHCGDYKSAGEPFYLEGPSKPAEEQQNRLLDSIFEQLVGQIAESRKLSADDVKKLIDRGLLSPEDAVKEKLVDELAYREDLTKTLKKRYGDDFKLDRRYGKDKGMDLDPSNPFAMFNAIFGQMMKGPSKSDKPAIALIYVDSMITSGSSEDGVFGGNSGSTTIRRAIEKAAQDKNIKAVVLRVDSPGGSAVASEVIAEAVKRCKKEKPLVVSMGNVAASGGYYVSCLSDAIFAEPGTITGSIGVVGGKMVTKGLWDWVGITGHEYQRGALADTFNSNRKFEDDERKLVTDMMYRVYGDFKDRVTAGRRSKIKGELESLAGGRVYTGKQALEIGLVDKLGGMADAIQYAADQAEMSKYELRILPEPKNLFDMLFKGMSGADDDEVEAHVQYGAKWMASPFLRDALPMLDRLDPHKGRAVRQALMQMDLMGRENVLMLDAGLPSIR